MNNVAISNHLLVNLLQNQNVKRDSVKKKQIEQDSKVSSNVSVKNNIIKPVNDSNENSDPTLMSDNKIVSVESTPIGEIGGTSSNLLGTSISN